MTANCVVFLLSVELKVMGERFKNIRSGKLTVDDLTSPAKVWKLPFPQSFAPLPADRFRILEDGTFEYMGRVMFKEIFNLWDDAVKGKSGLQLINVYGTPGSVASSTPSVCRPVDVLTCIVALTLFLFAHPIVCLQLRQKSHAGCFSCTSDSAAGPSGIHI